MAEQTTAASLPPAPPPQRQPMTLMSKCGQKTLAAAATLANLLPTGTVLAFQALIPSVSNEGVCEPAHKLLTATACVFCAAACFFSSFTDSFVGSDGKLYYGIATFRGLYVLNGDSRGGSDPENDLRDTRSKYKLCFVDFVHAFISLVVFLVFAMSGSEVRRCLLPNVGRDAEILIVNSPIGVGMVASFLFVVFPTTRRGIGCADTRRQR